jgi:hypothetical protein
MAINKVLFFVFALFLMGCANLKVESKNPNKMNLEYVKDHEGELLYFIGKFKCQELYKAFSTNDLVLRDGTRIVLTVSSYNDVDSVFISKNNNKRIKILGRVYVDEIPDKYDAIGRTDAPCMVEIHKAELYKR